MNRAKSTPDQSALKVPHERIRLDSIPPGIHVDRIARRRPDRRPSDRAGVTRRAGIPRSGAADAMHEQSQADRPGASRTTPRSSGCTLRGGSRLIRGLDTPVWGWGARLLGFVEQSPLVAGDLLGQWFATQATATVQSTTLAVFLCPSSPGGGLVERPVGGLAPSCSLNSLRAITSAPPATRTLSYFPQTCGGIFFCNSAVAAANITDGMSSTLLVGERSRDLSDATWSGGFLGQQLHGAFVAGASVRPRVTSFTLSNAGPATSPSSTGVGSSPESRSPTIASRARAAIGACTRAGAISCSATGRSAS